MILIFRIYILILRLFKCDVNFVFIRSHENGDIGVNIGSGKKITPRESIILTVEALDYLNRTFKGDLRQLKQMMDLTIFKGLDE